MSFSYQQLSTAELNNILKIPASSVVLGLSTSYNVIVEVVFVRLAKNGHESDTNGWASQDYAGTKLPILLRSTMNNDFVKHYLKAQLY